MPKKLNLEKLAAMVAAMEEDEKSAVIGGDWYYVASSNRFESIGAGDNVRIIEDEMTLTNNRYSSLGLRHNSTSLNSAESDQRNAALRAMGAMVGIDPNVTVSAAPYGNTGSGTSFAQTNYNQDSNGKMFTTITINSGTNFFNAANFYDLMCVLIHENVHANQYANNQYPSELAAYSAMVNDPWFQYCSPAFQQTMREEYEKQLNY